MARCVEWFAAGPDLEDTTTQGFDFELVPRADSRAGLVSQCMQEESKLIGQESMTAESVHAQVILKGHPQTEYKASLSCADTPPLEQPHLLCPVCGQGPMLRVDTLLPYTVSNRGKNPLPVKLSQPLFPRILGLPSLPLCCRRQKLALCRNTRTEALALDVDDPGIQTTTILRRKSDSPHQNAP